MKYRKVNWQHFKEVRAIFDEHSDKLDGVYYDS
jgi:hypothetical protein